MFLQLEPNEPQSNCIRGEWFARNSHWLADATPSKRRRRERNEKPLILCGHGVSLRVESGALVIRDGFTHYPQQQAKHRLYPGHRDTP
ncbi:hypothetical protein, partial [Sphingomonas antarctica]|uniref:hypothetical protein n=1 Tax=Sphingomonas antarctica TaxID=2040274 RepID=UPI0039E82154